MRAFQVALLVLAVPSVNADELHGELLVTTNYVWRGFTMSDDAPAVLGGLEYYHPYGWSGSAQVASVTVDDQPEQQMLVRAGLARPRGDWVFDAGIIAYEYVRGDRYDAATGSLAPGTANKDDFYELFIGASHGNGEFRYHRSEDYLGSGKLSNYYDLNYAAPLWGDARWIFHYGYTDSQAIADHAAQLSDMAFGIIKGPFAFIVTNLDDNEDGLQSRNPRFVVSWHQSIEF